MEKCPLFDLNHELTPLEKFKFFDILILFYFSLERRFCVLKYHKRHYPRLYCLKKKLEKLPFLNQNVGLTAMEKCQIFDFTNFLFLFYLKRRLSFLEYRKRHFSDLYRLKKKIGKMPIFGPKPFVNPFGKMSIFRLFQLVAFIA